MPLKGVVDSDPNVENLRIPPIVGRNDQEEFAREEIEHYLIDHTFGGRRSLMDYRED